jgi:hypothetical protein
MATLEQLISQASIILTHLQKQADRCLQSNTGKSILSSSQLSFSAGDACER